MSYMEKVKLKTKQKVRKITVSWRDWVLLRDDCSHATRCSDFVPSPSPFALCPSIAQNNTRQALGAKLNQTPASVCWHTAYVSIK